MNYRIPFNRPHLTGKEAHYMYQAVNSGKISGNGIFTQKCQRFFEDNYDFKKCLLTNSCTDALEMAAILVGIQPGDEVIVPAYTFVSTANAFVLRGAKIVFADSKEDNPCIDENGLEQLITDRTKAIVPVHYAGIACNMDVIMDIAHRHNIWVIEDAAQSIDSFYKGKDEVFKPLGSLGHLSTFSFHETKNIISGEGGMLVINDPELISRAEIIWEKGTNRSQFFRGEVNKYSWIDVGSSFLPSEISAAFLFAQLEHLKKIQKRRRSIWNHYYKLLSQLNSNKIILPQIPDYATNNGHMFYLVVLHASLRDVIISEMKKLGILCVFHYISLNTSPYSQAHGFYTKDLPNSDRYTNCLLRLPFYYEIESSEITEICNHIAQLLE